MKRYLRIHRILRKAGLDVRRVRPSHPSGVFFPPPLFDSCLEALYRCRGGEPAAFPCPFENSRSTFGFSYSRRGWHPHCAVVDEYHRGKSSTYYHSVLKDFYDTWQPRHASETVIGFEDAPKGLSNYPPYGFVPPWDPATPAARMKTVRQWCYYDCIEHGHRPLDLDAHGYFGPVSTEKGEFDFNRFITLYTAINRDGYRRAGGDVRMHVLKRESELLFIGNSGNHRRAVVRAVGHECIPAVPQHPMIIDTSDIDHWPQVRSGLWSRSQALSYVDHLFDFDSLAWARQRGLIGI